MTTANGSDSEYVGDINPIPPLYSWKRPEGPPRIWRVVHGRKKTASGKIPKYSIQEVPKDLENDVIDFMTKYFLAEELVSMNMRLADDPVGVRGVQAMWRDILHQGVSVVALEVNPDPSAKPVIGGINMLYVGTPEDKMNPIVKTMTSANGTDSKYVDYLNLTPYSWKRPEGPPRIWRVVEGRRKTGNSEVPRFSIQELPEELENDAVDCMEKYFIVEEPACVDDDLAGDPLTVREMRTYWRDIVRQGMTVVAITVNSDLTAKPVIAGINLLFVTTAEDEAKLESEMQFQSEIANKWRGMDLKLYREGDVLTKYGVDKYLTCGGLVVQPSFRGQGIGEELLRARDDIGPAYQIPVTATIFSGTVSQILAARVGFEVLVQRKYSELLDEEGKVAYPGVNVELIKLMGKRFY